MEDKTRQLQVRTNNNVALPAIATAMSLADIRLNEKQFPRYKNIPQPQRIEWLAGEIKTLAEITRIKDFGGRDAIMMAGVLDEMILQEFYMADLTLPEIHDAFKCGVFGKYGEFYGISAPNLYGFLESFINSDKKREAAELVRKTKAQMRAERTRMEYEAEQRKIRAEIEEAKRNGTFVPTGKAWYKPKSVNDAITESEEHRAKIRQQADAILRGSIK